VFGRLARLERFAESLGASRGGRKGDISDERAYPFQYFSIAIDPHLAIRHLLDAMNAATDVRPMTARLRDYAQLMRLDRPVGIWLLLWPTLWALWFAARGLPPLPILAIFVAGTVLMRSAGCVINDFADRNFDPHVERTKDRPLASRRVTPREALILFVVLCLLALLVAAPLNRLALLLSVPAAVLAASYPFAKRFHSMPQAHLGLAFSWGIPMAYAAVRGSVDWGEAGLLMGANVCWVIAYDTLYAMADREDDLRIGVKSSAILFDRYDRLAVAVLHAAALLLLLIAGREAQLGWPYVAGLIIAAGLAAQEQWMVRTRGRDACFRAFLHNVRFGVAVFAGIVVASLS
jgi:4-hydroxybenzoate polyprenyltransferase